MPEITLEQHLARRLRFLRNSCKLFDEGQRDEAIRIAVELRVLMHQGRYTPLLQQLGRADLEILSTVEEIEAHLIFSSGNLSKSRIEIGGGQISVSCEPYLDEAPYRRLLPWGDWWSQVVLVVNDLRLSRRDIAKLAANKEGAHVDLLLPAEYKMLQDGIFSVDIEIDGMMKTVDLVDLHFSDIRQMAYEVLSSADLIALGDEA
jgi:hypothetical protein